MIHHPICHTGRVPAQAWRRLPPTTVDGECAVVKARRLGDFGESVLPVEQKRSLEVVPAPHPSPASAITVGPALQDPPGTQAQSTSTQHSDAKISVGSVLNWRG
jgi:hypothetical protein